MTAADLHEALSLRAIRSRLYRRLCRLHGDVVVQQFRRPECYRLGYRAVVACLR